MRSRLRLSAVLLLLGGALGCASDPAAPAPQPAPIARDDGWPVASATAEGLDAQRLEQLDRQITAGRFGNIHSLLIARHGRLVWERYYQGWSVERAHTLQSVTKSVASLMAGIAVGDGRLDVDQRVTDFFPEYAPLRNLDARKQAMRVRDLLSMRTGLDWSEDPYAGSPLEQLNQSSGDWLRFVLDWPMREAPGTRWEYVSGGVIVLGGVIGKAEQMPVDSFAAVRLFRPLQMQGWQWYRNPGDGLPHSGGGLLLRPRDALKLGQLVLDGGRWGGTQVVPAEWIARSTARIVPAPRTLGAHAVDYGWLWWIGSLADPLNRHPEPGDVLVASGSGGQWIFIIPRYQLVVLSTGGNEDGRWTAAYDFLFSDLLPAVRG